MPIGLCLHPFLKTIRLLTCFKKPTSLLYPRRHDIFGRDGSKLETGCESSLMGLIGGKKVGGPMGRSGERVEGSGAHRCA